MKRLVLPALFVLSCAALSASPPREQALDALIASERAFAAHAASANTRDAFLTFLADDAVMFSNGPCNGRELYAKHSVDESLLSWAPSFADVATSGDFGYDTGPYNHRPKRTDAKPSRHGQFVTVWKKQSTGEWRVAFDTGLSHPAPENFSISAVKCTTSAQSQTPPVATPADSRQTLLDAERSLISQLRKPGLAVYEKILSADARLLYRRQFPTVGREAFLLQQRKNLEKDSLVECNVLTGETATRNDLGYAYGSVKFKSSTPEITELRSANYLRIWKRENGSDWRLVLELTGPG